MAITLDVARNHLSIWLKAEESVAIGSQSYKMGTRSLTRADLGEIRRQVQFWETKVLDLQNKTAGRGRSRGYRGVPRDL